jgi:uncharacterized coiled-coil DUF342 family protein
MSDDKNLELKSIIQKFSQSTSALDSLTEKISSLSRTSDEIGKSEAGISKSHLQIKRIADEIELLSKELKRANTAVEGALTSVATFLHGSELGGMKQGIDQIVGILTLQLTVTTDELKELRIKEQQVSSELSQLKGKVSGLPEKAKKKFGFL